MRLGRRDLSLGPESALVLVLGQRGSWLLLLTECIERLLGAETSRLLGRRLAETSVLLSVLTNWWCCRGEARD